MSPGPRGWWGSASLLSLEVPQRVILRWWLRRQESPGGPVVKTLCFHCRGRRFDPQSLVRELKFLLLCSGARKKKKKDDGWDEWSEDFIHCHYLSWSGWNKEASQVHLPPHVASLSFPSSSGFPYSKWSQSGSCQSSEKLGLDGVSSIIFYWLKQSQTSSDIRRNGFHLPVRVMNWTVSPQNLIPSTSECDLIWE